METCPGREEPERYDPAHPDHAISDISQKIEAINTARKKEKKLADEPKFVKDPKWDELLQENAKIMTAAELSKKNQHPDEKK